MCSGFPKRSCSIKELRRDDDSTSRRALGGRALGDAGWLGPAGNWFDL
jgi:hypothetical protein